jgi:hypothetical protein
MKNYASGVNHIPSLYQFKQNEKLFCGFKKGINQSETLVTNFTLFEVSYT